MDPEAGRAGGTRRYRMRCERDDLRAELPVRLRRVGIGAAVTLLVFVAGLLLGGSVVAAVGVAGVFGVPVVVAGGLIARDRRRLEDLDRRLDSL